MIEVKDMDLINDSVMNRLTGDFIKLSKVLDELNITVSAKQMSELVSALLENAIADNIDGAIAPKVDSEPDILYNRNSVEIKTSTGETWRGGTFSKRPGYYVYVKWELNHNGSPRFYIAGVQLQESDWKKRNLRLTTLPLSVRKNCLPSTTALLSMSVALSRPSIRMVT